MSSAWGTSFGSAWGDAWGPLGAVIAPPSPDFIPGGRVVPGRKTQLRQQARSDVRLALRCSVRAAASLAIPASVAVDLRPALDSAAVLRLAADARLAARPAVSAAADAIDVVLEMLLLAD